MMPLVHWTQEETKALIAVWSEEKIQRSLEESLRNEKVFREVSGRLAAMGMLRSAKQCRDKIKKLKLEYRRVKQQSERGEVSTKSFRWYDLMETTMSERTATVEDTEQPAAMTPEFNIIEVETDLPSTMHIPVSYNSAFIPSPAPSPTPCPKEEPQDPGFYSIQIEDIDGPSTSTSVTFTTVQTPGKEKLCYWSTKEVQALLTLWANPTIQEELLLNVRNNKVYTGLSAKLASLGFNKTPKKCREKIKKLKSEYKRVKSSRHRGGGISSRTSVWYAIMDDVLSSKAAAARRSETTEASLLSQSQSVVGVDTDDETQWLPDEVQVLMTLWAQPNIQKQLLTTATNHQVFMYLSGELALVGFNKTPHQCSLKVKNLTEEYRKIKEVEPQRDVRDDWFAILDSVLGAGEETSIEVDSSTVQPQAPEDEHVDGMLRAVWRAEEIKVLLTRWAEQSVQEQLRSTQRNDRVFAQLSSELATHGFDKTTSQCRFKIKQLKQKYKLVREQKDSKKQKSRWFTMLDKVLGRLEPQAEDVDSAQQDLSETEEDFGSHLSVSSLCLLVPTLRLMCAFAWRVVQCCNVLHYGKVEELVRLVMELAPELLTPRERVQLLLRLRAMMVLESCRSESTANLPNIQPHLEVIQSLTMGSTCNQEESEELEKSKSNFVEVVNILLEDTEERKIFFKEVFPIHYGQQYEATLHSLVWKFISRLDSLLPVPDIKQTAEWLGTAPSVMEECGQLVLEPEQLKALLHFHQQQSGGPDKRYTQTQNMFLPRLSFPHKPNSKPLASEQQDFSTGDTDEEEFDYSKDEENQTGYKPTLEDCGTAGGDDLKFNEEQSDDLTATTSSNSNSHMPLRLQTCSLCPFSDSQVSGLLQHIREAHLIQEPTGLQSKQSSVLQKETCTTNICEYCAKTFKDVSTLNSHRDTHTLSFHCDKCEKKYSSKASLNVHRRIHVGEKPFLCSHCGRGFRSSCSLGFHVRIHTGDRRYKCPICGKTSIQHLTRHMRMHRGEKNYLCTECGKAFLSSGELRLHMRFHTGERPYTCKHCGRGFIAKCHLTVHMRQHTGETPYRCSVCPKSFPTLRAQKRHMKIHSNKKSFQCLQCGKVFRQEDTFKMHVETHN